MSRAAGPGGPIDPVDAVNQLDTVWSDNFDDYATGRIDASQIRCVLCRHVPCDCPPFGSPEYMELLAQIHGR